MTNKQYTPMTKVELDTAFSLAVKSNNIEAVQELIQAGANVLTPIPYTLTQGDCDWDIQVSPLIYAVRDNNPKMVKVLVKAKQNLNKALHIAIEEGHPSVLAELIKGGADINYTDGYKNTPLILAIQRARPEAEFSLQAQARSRSRWKERRRVIEVLIEAGADVNALNKNGRTALMEAVVKHDLYTVKSLLARTKDAAGSFKGLGSLAINYADKQGNTALILAVLYARTSYINNQEYNICINSQKIVEELLNVPGIDLYYANKEGETAVTLLEKKIKNANH